MRQPIAGYVSRYVTGSADDERKLHLEEAPYLALEYQRDAAAQKLALAAVKEEEHEAERS